MPIYCECTHNSICNFPDENQQNVLFYIFFNEQDIFGFKDFFCYMHAYRSASIILYLLRWSCVILCTGNYVTGTLWEQKFWNVLLGVHILGKLHLEWGWTGNRGNFRHPGWESPVSGHWPVDWDHGTPQGRSGISELCTPGTYRWMMDTYSYI